LAWTIAPEAKSAATLEIAAGVTLALRLSRWRSAQILQECPSSNDLRQAGLQFSGGCGSPDD
jgi:hypothetical protein